MQLLNTFLKGLVKEQVSLDNVRLLGVEEILKKRINESINKFSKKHSLNQGSVSSMLKGKRAIPVTLLNLNKLNFSNVKWSIDGSLLLKLPIEIDEKLAYLVGALRDGTVAKEKSKEGNEYTVSFYSIDKEYLGRIRDCLKKCFDTKVKIEKFGDCYGLRIRSKVIYLFFKLIFEVPPKQVEWNTPKIIKNETNEIKREYITGFFDAEGSVPRFERLNRIKRKNLYVRFVQKNKESLEFIKKELEKNNISCGKVYFSGNKWNLKISNKSIVLFSKFIKPQHPKKAERLSKLAKLFSLCNAGSQGCRSSRIKRNR